MVQRGSYLFPYDPMPIVEAYTPVFERLAREALALRVVWLRIAPVWGATLSTFIKEEGVEIISGHIARRRGVGIILREDDNVFLVGSDHLSPKHVLQLLTYYARTSDDLNKIIQDIEDIIQRLRRAVRRLEEEAAQHMFTPERRITV